MAVTWEDFESVDQPKTDVDWTDFEAAPEDPRKAALQSQIQALRRQRVGGNILESAATLAGQSLEPLSPSGWLNQPARIAGYQDPFAAGRPIIPIPKPTGTGVMSGLGRLGANIAESFETPEGVVTLPALPFSRVIQALTAAQMAADTPEAVVEAVRVFKDPNSTTADKVAAAGNPIVQSAAAAVLARGPSARTQPVRPPMAEALASQLGKAKVELPTGFERPVEPIVEQVKPKPAKPVEPTPEPAAEPVSPTAPTAEEAMPEVKPLSQDERDFGNSLAKKYGPPVAPSIPATEPLESISRFSNMLERAADASKDAGELGKILDASEGKPDESRIAWAVANNPHSSPETFSKAKSNPALKGMASDKAIASLDARRSELQKQAPPEPSPSPAAQVEKAKGGEPVSQGQAVSAWKDMKSGQVFKGDWGDAHSDVARKVGRGFLTSDRIRNEEIQQGFVTPSGDFITVNEFENGSKGWFQSYNGWPRFAPESLKQVTPKVSEAAPTLTPAESTRLKSLTDKMESGKKLTSAEQKRYRALSDKMGGG